MKFWMVVCADISGVNFNLLERRGPRYIHDTRADAEQEAERLAVAYLGSEFAVLEAVAIVRQPEAEPAPRWDREPRPVFA